MPALSHTNKLGMVDLSEMKELYLTELENCLIARNILFNVFCYFLGRFGRQRDPTTEVPAPTAGDQAAHRASHKGPGSDLNIVMIFSAIPMNNFHANLNAG